MFRQRNSLIFQLNVYTSRDGMRHITDSLEFTFYAELFFFFFASQPKIQLFNAIINMSICLHLDKFFRQTK